MSQRPASTLDPSKIQTPAFVIEEDLLRHNLSVLRDVKKATGATLFQALKTWATWPLFTITKEYLDGTEVSSLNEARLGYDEFNKTVHIYSPAYKPEEFDAVTKYCSTIIFNSFREWKQFKPRMKGRGAGLRVNPESPKGEGVWKPTAPSSRLGIRKHEFDAALSADPHALDGISGIHFHAFWDNGLSELKEAITALEERFGAYFPRLTWVNFGGGQTITNDEYDVQGLITLINNFQKKHNITVHLEPGAAIVKNAGALVSTVLDIVERNDVPYKIAILDMSFNAHTPDFLLSHDLIMPVRGAEVIREESAIGTHANVYRLAGGTCVTGDQLSHFHAFKEPLKPGDKVVMEDGIQYNMVQCTMFNGVQHPSIVLWKNGKAKTLRTFTYDDFRKRMG